MRRRRIRRVFRVRRRGAYGRKRIKRRAMFNVGGVQLG